MAKKKVTAFIKLQIPAGAANPAPPVGPALGAAQVNIMQFCQAFNAATQDKQGDIIPVEITVYEDRSFDFVCKTPPAAQLIKKELGLKSGSGVPDQDAGPQRQRHRGRQEDRRRHRPLHGRHHRRVAFRACKGDSPFCTLSPCKRDCPLCTHDVGGQEAR